MKNTDGNRMLQDDELEQVNGGLLISPVLFIKGREPEKDAETEKKKIGTNIGKKVSHI